MRNKRTEGPSADEWPHEPPAPEWECDRTGSLWPSIEEIEAETLAMWVEHETGMCFYETDMSLAYDKDERGRLVRCS